MHNQEIIGERNEKGFFEAIQKMAKEVKKRGDFVVIHHHDADGCCAGAIVIKALEREGKKVARLCLKQLYRENLAEIRALGKNYLFVDFGSGQLDYLTEEFKENFFVLDHHQTSSGYLAHGTAPQSPAKNTLQEKSIEHKWHVNPLLFGINGGTELSGAGVTLFFALALNEKNADLSPLGIVGALGDMMDSNAEESLVGMNRKILEIAQKEKMLEIKKDLKLYGRISRPLISFLMYSSNPILPELTANEENCKALLAQLGIPLKDPFTEQWLSYEDLTEEQKRALTSALIINLAEHNVSEWKIKNLVGEVYTLLEEHPKSPLRDGKEFATMLNACGRNKRPEIALAVCLGDRKDAYGEALALMDAHRNNLRQGIEFIQKHGIEERKNYYFFDAGQAIDESIVGIIAGMLYGSIISETKPIIALARNTDGTIKLSGRGTTELVRHGMNLGKALKEIGQEIKGVEGGGHKIAAGAKIPAEKLEEFLEELEKKLAEQLVKY